MFKYENSKYQSIILFVDDKVLCSSALPLLSDLTKVQGIKATGKQDYMNRLEKTD